MSNKLWQYHYKNGWSERDNFLSANTWGSGTKDFETHLDLQGYDTSDDFYALPEIRVLRNYRPSADLPEFVVILKTPTKKLDGFDVVLAPDLPSIIELLAKLTAPGSAQYLSEALQNIATLETRSEALFLKLFG